MSNDGAYGPPLPPGFAAESDESNESTHSESLEQNSSKLVIGPQCPSSFFKYNPNQDAQSDSLEEPGPSEKNHNAIGPSLPPGLTNNSSQESDGEEEDGYGPLPAAQLCDEGVNDVVHRIENRSKSMKMHLDGTDVEIQKPQREEWMTVPNTSSRNQLGAISRCLSDHKSKPEVSTFISHKNEPRDRDSDAEESSKAKAKRQKSLLELHQKKKKKKEKKEKEKHAKGSSKLHERKPFDRDAELSVRLMSKDQVTSVISKSKFLNSRFSAGASKFL